MNIKIVLRNIFFIVLPAIFIFFILIEISLNLGSYAYARYYNSKMQTRNYGNAKYTKNILCLGDSFTFGVGTTFDNNYPSQLKILLEENATERVNVINGGRGCNTSSLLLKNLEKDIDTYSPDIIVIMIGCNNHWYLKDSSYFDLYRNKTDFFKKLDYFLSNSKAYKLMKITWINFKYKIEEHDKKITNNKILPEALNFSYIGAKLFAQGEDDLAMKNFNKAMLMDKNNYTAYLGMAHLWSARNEHSLAKEAVWNAVHAFVWLLNEGGENTEDIYYIINQMNRIYNRDEDLYDKQLEFIKLKKYFQDNLNKQKRENLIKMIEAKLHGFKDKRIFDEEVLEYDLSGIFNLIKRKNIKVVLQTYSNYPRRPMINTAIRKISEEYNIPLVDNEKIFEKKGEDVDIKSFFVPDGHCNAQGYRIIAENVYATLVNYNLISCNRKMPLIKDTQEVYPQAKN